MTFYFSPDEFLRLVGRRIDAAWAQPRTYSCDKSNNLVLAESILHMW
jgi:hypothetical protein